MKKILLSLFSTVLFTGNIQSQCAPNCTLYTMTSISPSIIPSAGTNVILSDDQVSAGQPIGFTFTFMCNAYNTFYISSNGFISFNPSVSNGCCSGQSIPSPGNAVNNMIAFDWNDLYPPGAGSIRYQTIGIAPNRILIVTYSTIPHCCNNGPAFNTGQIKLFETSNMIEIHNGVITSDGSTATQGIMNQAGNIAVAVAGRNGVTWTGTSDAYRFTISGGGPTAPAAILGNASICPGVTTIYSVAPMGGATSYNWVLPPGWSGSSVSNTISATPGATGILTVSATFSCGTSPITTLNVVVNPNPTITITGGNVAVCPSASVTLLASGANTYTWSTGPVAPSIVLNPTVTASYTVIGESAAGCTASAVTDVTVNPAPNVTISGTAEICAGGTVFLTANGASTYTWNTGSNSANIISTPSVNTTFSVVGTLGSCTGSALVNVTVNPLPVVTIAGNNTACAGSTLSLLASGANTYTWNTGALTPGITETPSANVTYTVYGTNTVTGCYNSATHAVTVNAIPSVTVTGPSAMCLGQSITLTGYGANSYSWSNGGVTQSIVVSPTANISYTLIGTSALGCSGAPVIKNVTVNSIPVIGITSTGTFICKGESVVITASGANTYSWNTGALTTSISVTPSVTTTYSVMGTNTATGCYQTVTISISVSPCTGLSNNSVITLSSLSLHPNPNNGEFVIELKNDLKKNIEVYDMIGRSVYFVSSDEDYIDISISDLANGIYYVKIKSDDVFRVVKIIKE